MVEDKATAELKVFQESRKTSDMHQKHPVVPVLGGMIGGKIWRYLSDPVALHGVMCSCSVQKRQADVYRNTNLVIGGTHTYVE